MLISVAEQLFCAKFLFGVIFKIRAQFKSGDVLVSIIIIIKIVELLFYLD